MLVQPRVLTPAQRRFLRERAGADHTLDVSTSAPELGFRIGELRDVASLALDTLDATNDVLAQALAALTESSDALNDGIETLSGVRRETRAQLVARNADAIAALLLALHGVYGPQPVAGRA